MGGMRISRPCYDKPRRCPGWAGGGWKYAETDHCPGDGPGSGFIQTKFEGRRETYDRLWKWRIGACDNCDTTTLPYMVRYIDPSNVRFQLNWWRHNWRDDLNNWWWMKRLQGRRVLRWLQKGL